MYLIVVSGLMRLTGSSECGTRTALSVPQILAVASFKDSFPPRSHHVSRSAPRCGRQGGRTDASPVR